MNFWNNNNNNNNNNIFLDWQEIGLQTCIDEIVEIHDLPPKK